MLYCTEPILKSGNQQGVYFVLFLTIDTKHYFRVFEIFPKKGGVGKIVGFFLKQWVSLILTLTLSSVIFLPVCVVCVCVCVCVCVSFAHLHDFYQYSFYFTGRT